MNCVFFAGCISMSFYRPYSNTNINNNNDNNNNDHDNNNNDNNNNNYYYNNNHLNFNEGNRVQHLNWITSGPL